MDDTPRSDWQRLSAGSTWQGRRLADRAAIGRFLAADRIFSAYAIGDLEPAYFAHSAWYGAQTEGQLRSLALVYSGLEPPALLLLGDAAGLALLLGPLVRERIVYATCRPEHRTLLDAYYVLGQVEQMERMVVRAEGFQPNRRHQTERLGPHSLGELRELYALDEGRGTFFSAEQLAAGVFYGVRQRGRLVSVAGTHIVAPGQGVAAVGNVFTHPAERGQGFAAACTSRVTEELLARQMLVVLNVRQSNAPAIHVYERLGYVEHCPFIEMPATRRASR